MDPRRLRLVHDDVVRLGESDQGDEQQEHEGPHVRYNFLDHAAHQGKGGMV